MAKGNDTPSTSSRKPPMPPGPMRMHKRRAILGDQVTGRVGSDPNGGKASSQNKVGNAKKTY